MDIKSWIKAARSHAELTQTQLGEPLGVSKGNVSAWEKGRHEPSFDQLIRIAELTGYKESLPGLAAGEPSFPMGDVRKTSLWPFPDIPEQDVRRLPKTQLSSLQEAMKAAIRMMQLGIELRPPVAAARPEPARGAPVNLDHVDDPFPMRIPGMPAPWDGGKTTMQMERELGQLKIRQDANVTLDEDSAYSANDHDFVRIPEMDVRLAAGKLGFENYHETQKGEIMFRRSFLESFGLPIECMSVLYGDGPSMKPVIGDGSPMLFFENLITDLRQIRPRFVYAINRGGEMLVKCLSRERGGQWLARSTNPDHKPFPIALEDGRDVRIVGQILWSPQDLRNGVDPRLL